MQFFPFVCYLFPLRRKYLTSPPYSQTLSVYVPLLLWDTIKRSKSITTTDVICAATLISAILTWPGSGPLWVQPVDVSEHLHTGRHSTSLGSHPLIPLAGWRPSMEILQTGLHCHWRQLCGSLHHLRYDGHSRSSVLVSVWSVQSLY